MANKEIETCNICGCFVFDGLSMQCANGHDISFDGKTRNDIVPYYKMMIIAHDKIGCQSKAVEQFNKRIMDKWSVNALEYIKNLAWKQ